MPDNQLRPSIGLVEQSPAKDLKEHDYPVVRIRPSGKWVSLNFGELWTYRELLYFLTWRDVKVRYKQTAFGAAWAIMQPLFAMLIFALFFGKLAGIPSDGIPYPIFAFVGLLPWTFFSNAVTASGNSLVGSSNLITKVYFPRMIIPGAAVLAGLVDFAIAFCILAILMALYDVTLTARLLLLPSLVVLTAALAVGIGMWTSALNVKYRDVRHALPFMVQLWFFATPIVYPTSIVPMRWRWAMALNPMTGIIDGYRSALLGRDLDIRALLMSTAIVVGVLGYAAYMFRQMERTFADIV